MHWVMQQSDLKLRWDRNCTTNMHTVPESLPHRAQSSSFSWASRSEMFLLLPSSPKKSFANWCSAIPSPKKWVAQIMRSWLYEGDSCSSGANVEPGVRGGVGNDVPPWETTRYDKRSFDNVLFPFRYESIRSRPCINVANSGHQYKAYRDWSKFYIPNYGPRRLKLLPEIAEGWSWR